ncbi:MAG: DUF3791 domain-containing protein [Bacteroidales bacterium]|jgi:hypothetical protein|nr:DUF3791 domain-containing protein [Bacteroidales bacterium]
METKTLSKQQKDKISFILFIIPYFARAYKMNIQESYFYLKKYGGWDYLNEHWWALHTDNPFWAVRDIFEICKENGGMR